MSLHSYQVQEGPNGWLYPVFLIRTPGEQQLHYVALPFVVGELVRIEMVIRHVMGDVPDTFSRFMVGEHYLGVCGLHGMLSENTVIITHRKDALIRKTSELLAGRRPSLSVCG